MSHKMNSSQCLEPLESWEATEAYYMTPEESREMRIRVAEIKLVMARKNIWYNRILSYIVDSIILTYGTIYEYIFKKSFYEL